MEKLKITKEPYYDYVKSVRIGVEAYEIIDKVSAETGKSKTDIANRMIKFAYKYLEIIEDSDL